MLIHLVSTWVVAESSVWKVQSGKSVAYIGGTCHILRETDYPLPAEFDRAYKASDTLVFETDIAKFKEPATIAKMMARVTYPDGSTVDKHLSAKAYAELSTYCQSNSIPLAMFQKFRPAMLMVTLTMMELAKLGATEEGVDQFYQKKATNDKKPVEGLETVDQQINYVATMAEGNEDEFVTYSLADMATLRQDFRALAKSWRKGDVAKLDELMVAELKTRMPKLYKSLVTDRNGNWLPLIEDYLKTPQIEFILVGVAHLVGPDGVIETLRKKGYKVEKL